MNLRRRMIPQGMAGTSRNFGRRPGRSFPPASEISVIYQRDQLPISWIVRLDLASRSYGCRYAGRIAMHYFRLAINGLEW